MPALLIKHRARKPLVSNAAISASYTPYGVGGVTDSEGRSKIGVVILTIGEFRLCVPSSEFAALFPTVAAMVAAD